MSEPGVADWFASGFHKFDAVLLENGVNMEGNEKYEELTDYLLRRLTEINPNLPIYCITSYPRPSTLKVESPANPCVVNADCAFENDRTLKRLAAKHPNCQLIEGPEMMDNLTNLTHDMVHMSDYGHIQTAVNLAKRITL